MAGELNDTQMKLLKKLMKDGVIPASRAPYTKVIKTHFQGQNVTVKTLKAAHQSVLEQRKAMTDEAQWKDLTIRMRKLINQQKIPAKTTHMREDNKEQKITAFVVWWESEVVKQNFPGVSEEILKAVRDHVLEHRDVKWSVAELNDLQTHVANFTLPSGKIKWATIKEEKYPLRSKDSIVSAYKRFVKNQEENDRKKRARQERELQRELQNELAAHFELQQRLQVQHEEEREEEQRQYVIEQQAIDHQKRLDQERLKHERVVQELEMLRKELKQREDQASLGGKAAAPTADDQERQRHLEEEIEKLRKDRQDVKVLEDKVQALQTELQDKKTVATKLQIDLENQQQKNTVIESQLDCARRNLRANREAQDGHGWNKMVVDQMSAEHAFRERDRMVAEVQAARQELQAKSEALIAESQAFMRERQSRVAVETQLGKLDCSVMVENLQIAICDADGVFDSSRTMTARERSNKVLGVFAKLWPADKKGYAYLSESMDVWGRRGGKNVWDKRNKVCHDLKGYLDVEDEFVRKCKDIIKTLYQLLEARNPDKYKEFVRLVKEREQKYQQEILGQSIPLVGSMSNFSDREDVQLFVLAKKYVDANQRISWTDIQGKMKGCKKPRDALRERFRTLKRTHGNDLDRFPRRFFVKPKAKARTTQAKTNAAIDATPKCISSPEDKIAVDMLLKLFEQYDDDD